MKIKKISSTLLSDYISNTFIFFYGFFFIYFFTFLKIFFEFHFGAFIFTMKVEGKKFSRKILDIYILFIVFYHF